MVSSDKLSADRVYTLFANSKSYKIYLPDVETDYIQGKIVADQQPYELIMLQDIRGRVSAGDVVVDIGANIGNHALFLAAVCDCEVHAFEPNQHLASALMKSAGLNQLSHDLQIYPCGLGADNTVGQFKKIREDNLGAQQLSVGVGELEVRVLDEIDFSRAVKLLKIDVEGLNFQLCFCRIQYLPSFDIF